MAKYIQKFTDYIKSSNIETIRDLYVMKLDLIKYLKRKQNIFRSIK
jgi:hypothetical protein